MPRWLNLAAIPDNLGVEHVWEDRDRDMHSEPRSTTTAGMNDNMADQQADYVSLLEEVKERVRYARFAALKAVNQELIGL